MTDPTAWWTEGVLYQLYPRSFCDTNSDGVGDLRGVIARLDHLAWLGVSGVWLTPTFPSPNADWGYDVSDYRGVHPELGTPGDLDELVERARRLGIRIVLDLVPNHTSEEHAWFRDARSSREAEHRDWYVWADPGPDGGPPNNWVSSFGGPAWTLDEASGQYYLHCFLEQQPDLNWWNPAVRAEFEDTLRSWFDRGIAGFRIDVVHHVVKDRLLRDNPSPAPSAPLLDRLLGQVQIYNAHRPEVHQLYRRWRRLADSYEVPRLLLGETYVSSVADVVPFYGDGDELHLAFNIPLMHAAFEAPALRAVVEQTEAWLPEGAQPVWTGSNHDASRFPTRWAGGDPARIRCALLMLLTLRGSSVLYYGDELGLPDTPLAPEQLRDPFSKRFSPIINRDAARTPMPWSAEPGGGFTDPAVEPWLPFGDLAACNVAAQRRDPGSPLSLVRDLITLRAAVPDLRAGAYETLAADGGLWAWRRGERMLVALNLADHAAALPGVHGLLRIGTDRSRDDEQVDGELRLGPWEGAVVWRDAP